jgi:thiol-disulfide isomerase/thioredoxin
MKYEVFTNTIETSNKTVSIKRICIVVLIIAQYVGAFAQSVTIKGKAEKSYWNTTLKAYVYDDHITKRQKQIGETSVDEKGEFSISFPMSTTTFVMLRVGNRQATLYCEPGKTYEAAIFPPDPGALETVGEPVQVNLSISISDSTELNYLIYSFDEMHQAFIAMKMGWNMKDAAEFEKRIDTFTVRMRRKFAFAKNTYLQDYITYTCASLQLTFKKNELLYNTYLKDKPVQWQHQEYMAFLDAFLTNVVTGAIESNEMKKQVNDLENLENIDKYFSAMKFMENNDIKELAMAKALSMGFQNLIYKKDHLSGLLQVMGKNFKNAETRKIALNLDYKYGRFLVGNAIPSFGGADMDGEKKNSADYTGKYVYLAFVRSDCKVCEEQYRLIADYKKKYGAKIEFVYIFIDKDPVAVKTFLQNYPKTNWPVLVNSGDKIREDYNVLSIPLYYFITPQGTFSQAPALEPGLDMEKEFDRILKKR